MKQVFITAVGAVLLAGTSIAQSTIEMPLGSFHSLEVGGGLEVELIQDGTEKMVLDGDEKNFGQIVANIDANGQLSVVDKRKVKKEQDQVKVQIHCKQLDGLHTSGAVDLSIIDSLRSPNLLIDLSGASGMQGSVNADKLHLVTSGASEVRLCGSVGQFMVTLSGASELDASCLNARSVYLTSSGASEASLNVTDSITVEAGDASEISYNGSPTYKSVKTSGASEVNMHNGEDPEPPEAPNPPEPPEAPEPEGRHKRFPNDWKDRFERPFRERQDLVWMGIDLGVDGFVDKDFNFQPQGDYGFMELNYLRSTNVRLNFFEWRFNLAKNVLNIVTGMGFEWYHYAFNRPIKFGEAIDYPGQTFNTPVVGVMDSVHAISRSRLVVQNFCIPLFINLRTKKTARHHQQFNFSFGVVGAVRIGSNSRITYTEQGDDVRDKNYDDFNLNLFSATAMVRIKYSFFSLYVSYQFTPMFKGDNPGLRPISLGVTLLSF